MTFVAIGALRAIKKFPAQPLDGRNEQPKYADIQDFHKLTSSFTAIWTNFASAFWNILYPARNILNF